jgi:mRNA interferase MazF
MKGGIVYKQKDIVLIPFPYTDLTGTKLRPAIILSNDKLNRTEDRICCLVTSKPSKEGILITQFETGELPFKSWVKPHRIFTIDKKIVKRKMCTIKKEFHKRIMHEINSFTNTE